MNIDLHNSIGFKLLRIVFGFYLIVTIIVTVTQLYYEYAKAKTAVIEELYNVGHSFEDGLKAALWSLDTNTMESILVGINKIGIVSGVKITDINGKIEASNGIYLESEEQKAILNRIESEKALATAITIGTKKEVYYEYQLPIHYKANIATDKELIGYVYFYADQNSVISEFKDSLYLILINAVIKTAALWIIFLFFSLRLLSRPLTDLSQATSSFVSGKVNDDIMGRIKSMSQSKNQNELQCLASSFLTMHENILEKIDNLNALNKFAFVLTQASNENKAYLDTYQLLKTMFGIKGAIVINDNKLLTWTSGDFKENITSSEAFLSTLDGFQVDILRARNEVKYGIFKDDDDNQEGQAILNEPALYLPFSFGNRLKHELWLFGEIQPSRLDQAKDLKIESHSCLQVIINMLEATLTNLAQNGIIEEQKNTLEKRVSERTKELAKLNEELRFMAVHDPLTQLPNRTLFNDRLNHMITIANRENKAFAVASIDLTNFKQINDTNGHAVGDAILIGVGQRLADTLRGSDTLARMGGDEFAAIFSCPHSNSIHTILSNLTNALKSAIPIGEGESLLVHANIGIALFPQHSTDATTLFKYADIAMYQAKKTGIGSYIFDESESSKEKEYFDYIYDLEHAIEKGQLVLHYQPIIDLTTNKPISCEALLRWDHPEKGIISPEVFIPYAERSMTINAFTLWVFEQACTQCKAWHNKEIFIGISVNLSPRVFSSLGLPEKLMGIAQRHNLDPNWIRLEITESTAMDRPEQAFEILSKLNNFGFCLSIDDFGTGHSSLSYLTVLPVNELKIDRSFLLKNEDTNKVIVKAIIELSHTLDFHVVAEGIEDEKTLKMLIDFGCNSGQGFYLCQPAGITEIDKWLDKHWLEDIQHTHQDQA